MSKKMRYLLLVLVMIVLLMLAACGGDDDKDDNKSGGDSSDSVSLSQSFESDDGISVKYPEGWTVQDMGGQIGLASSAAAMDAAIGQVSEDPEENKPARAPDAGDIVVAITAYPLAEMGMGDDTTIDTIVDMMTADMSDDTMTLVGDANTVKIGENDAHRLNITSAELGGDGFVLAYLDENDMFVMLIGMTATGERDSFNDVVYSIAETIAYATPAGE